MIVATAGHVDHGKTSLVRALTGVDTDRLAEEKARGLTIELGFAYRDLDNGGRIGFVDVPGHERFVHTMLAGAGGVDAALLVIAADDGVMPQTREHLTILDILGVTRGCVAISKCDRVDDARMTAVCDRAARLLAGSTLADVPVFKVSAVDGTGVDALWSYLCTIDDDDHATRAERPFRMAVDRAFTLSGAGRVVTGTAQAGRVSVGDKLLLLPSGTSVRVRGLRALDREAETGKAGQRLGINIAGGDIGTDKAGRGTWLVDPVLDGVATRLDVALRVPSDASRPFASRGRFHVHVGTAHVMAEGRLLGAAPILPGETGFVRLRLDRPVHAMRGDRLVLRDASARRTVAGAIVIDPCPPKHNRRREDRIAVLKALSEEAPGCALARLLDLPDGEVALSVFCRGWQLSYDEAEAYVALAGAHLVGAGADARIVSADALSSLKERVVASLQGWHAKHPDAAGIAPSNLARYAQKAASDAVFDAAVNALLQEGGLARRGAVLALKGHVVAFAPDDAALWRRVFPLIEDGGALPPRLVELSAALDLSVKKLEPFLARATRMGLLHDVAANRFYGTDGLRRLAQVAARLDGEGDGFDAKAFRDSAGIGRNLAIEVLEYFDRIGLTRRKGDRRHFVQSVDALFPEPVRDTDGTQS